MPAESANVLDLETISDNGQAPKSRLSDAKTAREIVSGLLEDGRGRSLQDTKIKGMFDGNPPYNPGTLRAHGQAWRSNVNFREGKALLSAALTPYYDLFSSTPYYAAVQMEYDEATREKTERNQQVVIEEFDYLLKSYDGFEYNMQAMLHDMVGFGRGFLMWPDTKEWQFRHIPYNRVKVPEDTNAFSGNLDLIVILEACSETKLWGYIKDKQKAKDVGWNPAAVVRAIQSAVDKKQDSTWDYEYYQQRIKDNDITYSQGLPVIKLAHLYVKEFSGEITHLIVREELGEKDRMKDPPEQEEFLFQKEKQYDKFGSAVATFFLEVLDGSWNGMSGLGKDIYTCIEVKTRLQNKINDNAFMRADIILQPTSAAALDKNTIVQSGGITIIPKDYTVHPGSIFGDMQGLIDADQTLNQKLQINTGVYRHQLAQKQQGNPPTAKQVELEYSSQAVLTNSAVNRFYFALDKLYTEIYHRVVNETPDDSESAKSARKFRENCKKRGVPLEALKKIRCVRAFRALGNGSTVLRQQTTEALSVVAPMFPESGKQKWLKDYVAVHANMATADRYVPEAAIQSLPTDQQNEAMLENAAMKIGAPVTWTPTQNNVIHAQAHLLAASQASAMISQGGNPLEIVNYLDALGEHTAVHLGHLSNDPLHRNEFKALEGQWKVLGQVTDKIHQQISKAQEMAQQQAQEQQAAQARAQSINNGTDPDTQIKAAQAAADMRLDEAKSLQQIRNRQRKFEQDTILRDAKMAAQIRSQK